ncbi:MAG: hypothetical protein ABT16_00800 [Rhodanobacter sp. SCN 65-17]|nr:MAG: hypothetical protein ABT16_00800 [Rhodanobacter sp. SCN 65-17]
MTITRAVAHLVKQGYHAWLHALGLAPGPDAARMFADTMTDDGQHTYESLRRSEVEKVLRDES